MSLQQEGDQTGKTDFEKAIERATGESIESLRSTPIDERRRRIEQKFGKPMKVTSIGPSLVSHQQVEAELDKALR
ncbi:MAG: hypothetical protein ABSA43_00710 [Candidatus Microgenomates bacterium]|jgi:hypothetical protein